MGKAFDIGLAAEFLPKLLFYLPITLLILVSAITIGIILGFVVASIRLYKIPVLSSLAVVYVSFIRGTPTLIQLFLVYYAVPELLRLVRIDVSQVSPLYFVIVTYGLSSGAFLSEVIRSAVNSIDRGQTEAAYSIGMTGAAAFLRIVMPQALSVAFPNFANTVVSYLKDTSLAFSLGVMDMVGRAETLSSATNHAFEVYIALSVIYYAVCIVLEKMFAVSEAKLQRHDRSITVS